MWNPHHFGTWKVVLSLLFLFLCADRVFAYAGPGAGLELVNVFLGLLAWVGTAFVAIVLYPIYAFIRHLRGPKKPDGSTTDVISADESEPICSRPLPHSAPQTLQAVIQTQEDQGQACLAAASAPPCREVIHLMPGDQATSPFPHTGSRLRDDHKG